MFVLLTSFVVSSLSLLSSPRVGYALPRWIWDEKKMFHVIDAKWFVICVIYGFTRRSNA